MNRVDVVIKDSLFKKVDLEVDRCAAYRDDVEDRIYIYGSIICTGKWDDEYYLRVKANLCDENGDIVEIHYDFDDKQFYKIGYDTFEISSYKLDGKREIKYVELYPKIKQKSSD